MDWRGLLVDSPNMLSPTPMCTANQTRGAIEMTASMLVLGTIGYFVLVSGQPISAVVFWRCLFGAATLLVVCAALGLLRGHWSWRVVWLSTAGGLAIVANWYLLFSAYGRTSISIATVIYNTSPFMLVALGAVFLGERLNLAKIGWLMLAFLGMALIVQARPGASYAGSDYGLGIAMALGAALLGAIAALVTKKLTGTPPHLIALIQVSVGVVMLAPFAELTELPHGGQAWSSLVLMGVVHTGLIYMVMYGAVQKLPTHLQGSLSFMYAISAMVVDRVAFGHQLQAAQLGGVAAILCAVVGMSLCGQPAAMTPRTDQRKGKPSC